MSCREKFLLLVPRNRGIATQGHTGKAQVGQEAEGVKGNVGKSLCVDSVGRERKGKQAKAWLV